MPLRVTVRLDTNKTALDKIKARIFRKLITIFRRRESIILDNIKSEFRRALNTSPAIVSLRAIGPSTLSAEFGLSAGMAQTATDSLINDLVDQVNVGGLRIQANRLGLHIGLVEVDYKKILDASYAEYTSYPSGITIPWLRWLLLEADSIRIIGWSIVRKPGAKGSRSGYAIMVPSKRRFWRIRAPFNVPASRNFVIQILEDPAFQQRVSRAATAGMKGRRTG